jgi:hypothetical protein
MTGVTVQHEYKSPKAMERGVANVARKGWEVVSTTSYTPRKGLLRTLAGGFLFFNPKPRFVVTYRRVVNEPRG